MRGVKEKIMNTVQYKSSRIEIWKWYWRSWARANGLWIYHALFSIIFAPMYVVLFQKPLTVSWLLAGGLVGFLVCMVAFPIFPQIKFKPAIRTLTIDKQGISTTIGTKSGNKSWKDVELIENRNGSVIITGINKNAFIIPPSAFEDNEARELFIENAHDWHKAANA